MPFNLHSAPKAISDLLQWITQQHGICHIMHYLDNFSLLEPPGLNVYMSNKSLHHCQMLQSFRGSSCIVKGGRFLHLTILLRHSHWYYSHAVVPQQDKLQRIKDFITAWLCKDLLLRERFCHLWACSNMQLKLYIVGDYPLVTCMQLQQKWNI